MTAARDAAQPIRDRRDSRFDFEDFELANYRLSTRIFRAEDRGLGPHADRACNPASGRIAQATGNHAAAYGDLPWRIPLRSLSGFAGFTDGSSPLDHGLAKAPSPIGLAQSCLRKLLLRRTSW